MWKQLYCTTPGKTGTLILTHEKSLNSFHRRLLRIAVYIQYPNTISSQKLNITKEVPITERIKRRRLASWNKSFVWTNTLQPRKPCSSTLPLTKALLADPHSSVLNSSHKISQTAQNTTTSKPPLTQPSSKNLKTLPKIKMDGRERL